MPLQPAVLGTARLNNFRLDYQSAALEQIRDWRIGFWLDGEPVRHRVRVGSVEIHDVLNDAPNTASWRMAGTPPPDPGMQVRITINANAPRLLFNGTLETTVLQFEGKPTQIVYGCTAIDDTTRADHRRPFGLYQNVSATTVAQDLVFRFAPGLTAAHVQADLAPVTVAFDGTEGFNGALRAICKIIGGYFYWEDGALHLFLEETLEAPDPLTPSTPTLYHDPPIAATSDESQVRTRVYGRGYGSTLLLPVVTTDTILPLANASLFTATGGLAIASTTSDGSPTERLAYTGVIRDDAGTLVGPGVTPGGAPVLTIQAGPGLAAGTYQYAYTWATATGETLPGARATITLTGVLAPPTDAPLATPSAGTGLSIGPYSYLLTNLNAYGETTNSPISTIQTGPLPAPAVAPSCWTQAAGWTIGGDTSGSWPNVGDTVTFRICNYELTGGQTLVGPVSNAIVLQPAHASLGPGYAASYGVSIPGDATQGIAYRRVFLYANGAYTGFFYDCPTYPTTVSEVRSAFIGPSLTPPLAPIATATAFLCRTTVQLPIGPAGTTSRRLYRTAVYGAQFKLLTAIWDNTTTSLVDALPDASLPATLAPTVNTAAMAQVVPSGIGTGPGATTQRHLYRTLANGSALKRQQTIANNTATDGVVDTSADGALGVAAPTSDTSGFTQPTGQVPAGSTTLLTAGAPFPPTGGVVLVGSTPVRYSGLSGNTLTGIPAAGPGSLVVAVSYGTPVMLAPALTGVTGLTQPLAEDSAVHVFVQRDDLAAQAAAAARESTATYTADGIHEHMLTDERRAEPSLTALCDADLRLFAYPLVTVQYVSADVKTKSGKPITIALPSPAINETLVIQDVTISQLDLADGVPPRFATSASSVKFSLEDLLRRMSALIPE